jgi:tetratricopeptide (TPR) repeat protein
MRIDIVIGAVLAAITLLSPAMAASERDRRDCGGDDPARMIRGCTQVIEDASESLSNRALALYMRGLAYVTKGDPDRAITDYNEAIRLNPNNGLTFNERGLAYKAKDDLDRALADFNEAVRLNSDNADIHYNRGNVFMKKGDLDHAIADLDEAIRLGPANIVAIAKDDAITRIAIDRIKADYFGARGQAKFLQANFEDAASDYARFVQFHRDEPYTILRLYLARARSGQPSGAAELESSAAALKQPDWPFPVVELFLGRKTAAETLAAATTPDQRCEAQYYIGEWYLQRGEKTAALPALQAAADTCPKAFDEFQLAQFELRRFGR